MRLVAPSLVFAAICTISHVGCSASQTAPAPTASLLAVTCEPAALSAIGQQARCQARVVRSDSTSQDATASAQWSSSNPGKVSVSAGGLIEAVAPGVADITAAVQNLTGRQAVSVTSPCSFLVSPRELSFPSEGGAETATITTTPSGCSPAAWSASNTSPGLTFTPAAGDGDGRITIAASANTATAQAVHTATVAGETVTVSVAAARPPLRTLTLTLAQGEQLSGPWAGTVTAGNGFTCTLTQRDATVACPPFAVEQGTSVDLLVSLAPNLANLGFPIRRTSGCDALSATVCSVNMDRDRDVRIEIGWSVSPIR